MTYKHLLFILVAGTVSTAHALNWKCGIDISFSGTPGVDYMVEQLYHDSLYDDRSVVYLKSTTQITLEHNGRNINYLGTVHADTDSGYIYYKIDGDELHYGFPWGRGAAGPDPAYSPPYHLYGGPFNLSAEKGITGKHNPASTYGDEDHFYRGLTDSTGDEWHILTYWDDDQLPGEGTTNDGKIVLLVLAPGTPAIRFTCADTSAEYYTTPPKQYFIPRIYERTTYLQGNVLIHLADVTGGGTVQYRVDDGAWQTYAAPLDASVLFTGNDSHYLLQYRNGSDGTVKTRHIHHAPASPGAAETHPSSMCWKDETGKQAILDRVNAAGGYDSGLFGLYRKNVGWSGSDKEFHDGLRHGKRAYSAMQGQLSGTAVVAGLAGYDLDDYAHANRAKSMLLYMYAIDPIGIETPMLAGAYRDAPCMERICYPGDNKYPDVGLAYDLMAGYTTTNGYTDGFTPIEELKVRDNLANDMNLRLRWSGRDPFRDGGYGSFWQVYMEAPLAAGAIALPTYSTPYYGTSGADGSTAEYYGAPFPDQKISWWDYCNGRGESMLRPNMGSKSIFVDQTMDEGTWAADGYWFDDDRSGYQRQAEEAAFVVMAMRARYDGFHYPRLENYIDMNIRTRHPGTGESFPFAVSNGYVNMDMRCLINDDFEDAGVYAWHNGVTGGASAFRILYHDDTVEPQPLEEPFSKKYDHVLSFGNNLSDSTGILFRMLNKHINTTNSNNRVPATTHFNLDAYGEMLVIDGAGYGEPGMWMGEHRNAIMVDDTDTDGEFYSGISHMLIGRLGPALLGRSCNYGRVTTRTDLNAAPSLERGSCYWDKQIQVTRHALFPDKKYVIIIDDVTSGTGSHTYGWTLHGSSDGNTAPSRFSVDNTANTATWVKNSGVSLQAHVIAPDVDIVSLSNYSWFTDTTESYIKANAVGTDVQFVTTLLPLDNGQAAPTIADVTVSAGTAFSLDDGTGTVYCHTQDGTGTVTVGTAYSSDGSISLAKSDGVGGIAYGSVINGTHLTAGGTALISASAPMNLYFEKPDSGDTLVQFMVKPDTSGVAIPVRVTVGGLTGNATYGILRDGQADTNVTTDASGNAVISVLALNDVFGQEPREYTITGGTVGISDIPTNAPASAAFTNPVRIGSGITFRAGTVVFDQSGNPVRHIYEPGIYYVRSGNTLQKLVLIK